MGTTAGGYLPIEPLRAWLEVRANERGGQMDLARELGIDCSQLQRICQQPRVTLRAADALFTAAAEPHTFAILYPLIDGGVVSV